MENIKFYIDFFGGGDAKTAWDTLKLCDAGRERWNKWVRNGNDPFAYVPPDGWWWLKIAAVAHRNATSEMLEKGLGDEDWVVRRAAVLNPNTTEEVLKKGAADKHWEVRRAAVSHPNATAEVLKKGAADEHQIVREAAMCHHNFGK